MKIAVIDYGVSNIYNIWKALTRLGADVTVTTSENDIQKSDALILPGVGAYGAGVEGLLRHRLMEPIREYAASKKPVLGICLGAQLLMSEGYEFGVFKGLGLIPGVVERFPNTLADVKVPHIGWNAIESADPHDTILERTPNAYMYFNHSYYLHPSSSEHVLATTTYGGFTYAAAVKNGNIYGTQFHPEKSAEDGLTILKTFLEII